MTIRRPAAPKPARKPALLAALLAASTLSPIAAAHAISWQATKTLALPVAALLGALDGVSARFVQNCTLSFGGPNSC